MDDLYGTHLDDLTVAHFVTRYNKGIICSNSRQLRIANTTGEYRPSPHFQMTTPQTSKKHIGPTTRCALFHIHPQYLVKYNNMCCKKRYTLINIDKHDVKQ